LGVLLFHAMIWARLSSLKLFSWRISQSMFDTTSKLDQFSSRLASYLVTFGVGPGTLIPICFEKSIWWAHFSKGLGVLLFHAMIWARLSSLKLFSWRISQMGT
jgi:hypothetical protein